MYPPLIISWKTLTTSWIIDHIFTLSLYVPSSRIEFMTHKMCVSPENYNNLIILINTRTGFPFSSNSLIANAIVNYYGIIVGEICPSLNLPVKRITINHELTSLDERGKL